MWWGTVFPWPVCYHILLWAGLQGLQPLLQAAVSSLLESHGPSPYSSATSILLSEGSARSKGQHRSRVSSLPGSSVPACLNFCFLKWRGCICVEKLSTGPPPFPQKFLVIVMAKQAVNKEGGNGAWVPWTTELTDGFASRAGQGPSCWKSNCSNKERKLEGKKAYIVLLSRSLNILTVLSAPHAVWIHSLPPWLTKSVCNVPDE